MGRPFRLPFDKPPIWIDRYSVAISGGWFADTNLVARESGRCCRPPSGRLGCVGDPTSASFGARLQSQRRRSDVHRSP